MPYRPAQLQVQWKQLLRSQGGHMLVRWKPGSVPPLSSSLPAALEETATIASKLIILFFFIADFFFQMKCLKSNSLKNFRADAFQLLGEGRTGLLVWSLCLKVPPLNNCLSGPKGNKALHKSSSDSSLKKRE